MRKSLLLATAAGFAALVGTGSANAADKLKVGVTATLEGTYTVLGEDGMRGYELAVEAHGGKSAGKEIETIVGSTDASPDSALRAAKKLVEQDKVDMMISPLSGAEGIAMRDYSKTQPQITVHERGRPARWRRPTAIHLPVSRRLRRSIAPTWTGRSGTRGSATTPTTSSITRKSQQSAKTTHSCIRR